MAIGIIESQGSNPPRLFESSISSLHNNKYILYWRLCKAAYSNTPC